MTPAFRSSVIGGLKKRRYSQTTDKPRWPRRLHLVLSIALPLFLRRLRNPVVAILSVAKLIFQSLGILRAQPGKRVRYFERRHRGSRMEANDGSSGRFT